MRTGLGRATVRTTVAAAAGAFLTVAGCNSASLPFSQFESSGEQADCRLFVLCGDYPDQATCLASIQVEPHYYDTLGQDITSGKVHYDGVKASACIDAINAVSSCNRTAAAAVSSDLDSDCTVIFTGTVAVGGPCFFDEECASGHSCTQTDALCDPVAQCCPGTCAATLAHVPVGGDCSTGVCAAGSNCTENTTPPTCVQLATTEGAACTSSAGCAAPLYCDAQMTPLGPGTNTCRRPTATGAACYPSLGPVSCDSVMDTCGSSDLCVPLMGVGQPCEPGATCVNYAICDPTTNTCVARPEVGQPCTEGGPTCPGGTCDPTTSLCTLQPTAGACS